jgi:hypothetical protein
MATADSWHATAARWGNLAGFALFLGAWGLALIVDTQPRPWHHTLNKLAAVAFWLSLALALASATLSITEAIRGGQSWQRIAPRLGWSAFLVLLCLLSGVGVVAR